MSSACPISPGLDSTKRPHVAWPGFGSEAMTAGGSGQVTHKREPGEQAADRQPNREQDVKRGETEFAALIEQCAVERESGESRVAAENAGGEEEPPGLRSVAFEGEIAGEQPHQQ